MKLWHIILTIIILALLAYFLFAASGSRNISWIGNTEADMSHYVVYAASGADSSALALDSVAVVNHQGANIDHSYSHDFGDTEDLPWIMAGLAAVDSSGNYSNMAISRIYNQEEFEAPAMVRGLGISK